MKSWKKVKINPDTNIKAAINKINQFGTRILVVCNSKNKLLGTVTDGDIRRALIKGIDFNKPIKTVMNKNPITAKPGLTLDEMKSIMINKKILNIPIIKNHQIINIVSLDEKPKENNFENHVLIMAGGFGKRLYPITKKIPKPLIKIGKKPILLILVEKLFNAGFRNIWISTHYKANEIKKYFKSKKLNDALNINFIYEKNPLGTAGAIKYLSRNSFNQSLIVMNADLVTDINFSDLLSYHKKNKSIATVVARKYDFSSPYAELKVKNKKILSLNEKPSYSSLINAGIYVIDYEFIKNIKKNIKIDITDVIVSNINNGKKISYYPIYEKWIDIGKPEDLERARRTSI